MSEATALCAIAKDRHILAAKCLANEIGNNHSVTASLTGPDRVEETSDHGRHVLLFPIGNSEELVDRLRAGIAPSPLDSRAHNQIVVFAERHALPLAVDF